MTRRDAALPYYAMRMRGHAREMLIEAHAVALAEAPMSWSPDAPEMRALVASHALAILERDAGIKRRSCAAPIDVIQDLAATLDVLLQAAATQEGEGP